jgi:hypothetical protein
VRCEEEEVLHGEEEVRSGKERKSLAKCFVNFYSAFHEILPNKRFENFPKVILQNCRETNFVQLLKLFSFRNMNSNSIFSLFCK